MEPDASLFSLNHHGATTGVTGSCHELVLSDSSSVLIDCGLFQGAETSGDGSNFERLQIEFPIDQVRALVVTHVHIDHVGRIPYLMAAVFRGSIICSEASALLLPLVLEDALKIGFTRNARLIKQFLEQIKSQIVALQYKQWMSVTEDGFGLRVKLQPAGHIIGSAYVECAIGHGKQSRRVVFSGDLGAPYTPLLPTPKSPYRADVVVLESTYGDHVHENRHLRVQRLKQVVERALSNRGVVLIPAFSIGRTQELLYELEQLIHQYGSDQLTDSMSWDELEVIVDSPLAAKMTHAYRQLRPYWDKEAKRKTDHGRHPLSFEQMLTIKDHKMHLHTVKYLADKARPTIVLAASGMCTGGRVVNYLKALIEDSRHDILFVGYQARGTVGRIIQKYGPGGGYVDIDGDRYDIRAHVHTIYGLMCIR